jgi:hypothetical protein
LYKGRIPTGTVAPVRQAIADSILPDHRTSLEDLAMHDNRPRAAACACAIFVGLALLWNTAQAADGPGEPLHLRINRLMDVDRIGPPIAPASDSEFLRRVSLDLTGMPPSAGELRAFVADMAADKRARAIDRLLESPLFTRHWATTLDVMLMERRPFEQVKADEWQAYILDAARRNRPFDELVGELLRQDGGDLKRRAPARFYLDRESAPNGIARDVGRIFFGRDLQCAQCHNHPLVEDYRQSDYQGLLAFFSPGSELIKMEGMKKTTFFPETAAKDVAFDSVFVKDDHHLTGPRLPGGPERAEPASPPGDEYKVKPAGYVLPVPRHSRRAMLTSLIVGGGNRAFNENLANRLWAMMMGRGLVHPVDLHHPANPPSHPDLLSMLGQEIVALKFDVKPFLRELALTKAYQRSMDLPEDLSPLSSSLASELAGFKSRSKTLESAAESAKDEYRKAEKAWHKAEGAVIPLVAEEDKALLKYAEVAKKEDEAKTALAAAEAAVASRRDVLKALGEAAGRANEVVKKLPKEKDLADAARVFANRAAAASKELAAVEQASAAKAAALKRIGEERAAVARTIDAIRARIRPVREAVRREEALALEARRKKAASRVALEDQQRRVATLEAYVRWHGIRERLDANRREIEALGHALSQATYRSTEYAAVLRSRRDQAKSADQARIAAEKARADAEAARERQEKGAANLDSALAAVRDAEQLMGSSDATLSGVTKGLQSKAGELRAALPGLNAHVEVARTGLRTATEAAHSADEAVRVANGESARRGEAVAAAKAKLEASKAASEALRIELTEAADELTSALGNRFALAQLKPLTPEQMCWSILKVAGVYDRYREAEEAALAKAKPLTVAAANDPAIRRDRAVEVEERTFDKLKGNLPAFIRVYGAGAGQPQNDFFATVDQALFAANGGSINGWIAPAGGNISERIIAEKDGRKAAEDLYFTILSRPPTDEETADVVGMLSAPAKEKPAVVQQLVWGLLTSVEFRFNH